MSADLDERTQEAVGARMEAVIRRVKADLGAAAVVMIAIFRDPDGGAAHVIDVVDRTTTRCPKFLQPLYEGLLEEIKNGAVCESLQQEPMGHA
jgi:hypothetical protein